MLATSAWCVQVNITGQHLSKLLRSFPSRPIIGIARFAPDCFDRVAVDHKHEDCLGNRKRFGKDWWKLKGWSLSEI